MVAISVSVLCAKYSYQGDVVLGWTLWGNCLCVPENFCYLGVGCNLPFR